MRHTAVLASWLTLVAVCIGVDRVTAEDLDIRDRRGLQEMVVSVKFLHRTIDM